MCVKATVLTRPVRPCTLPQCMANRCQFHRPIRAHTVKIGALSSNARVKRQWRSASAAFCFRGHQLRFGFTRIPHTPSSHSGT